jgi:hypothetical protein
MKPEFEKMVEIIVDKNGIKCEIIQETRAVFR